MERFKKLHEHTLEESAIHGVIGTLGGAVSGLAGLITANPALAVAGGALLATGLAELLTSSPNMGAHDYTKGHGVIMSYLDKIKSERDLQKLGPKDGQKILDAAAEIKQTRYGYNKGTITKYENKIATALKRGDAREIMNLLRLLVKELERDI